MDEERFVRYFSENGSGNDALMHSSSIYEGKVPLIYHVLCAMGCVVRIHDDTDDHEHEHYGKDDDTNSKLSKSKNSNSNNRGKDAGVYRLDQFQSIQKPETKYLDAVYHNMKKVYFYEAVNYRRGIGIMALFQLTGNSSAANDSSRLNAICNIWIITPNSNDNREVTAKLTQSAVQNLTERYCIEQNDEHGGEEITLTPVLQTTVHYSSSPEDAQTSLNAALTKYAQSRHGATLLLVSSTTTTNTNTNLKSISKSSYMPILHSFPQCTLSAPEIPQSSLQWQRDNLQTLLWHYIESICDTVPDYIHVSRYTKIPIGNLGSDDNNNVMLKAYDVCFMNSLKKSKCVLWANVEARPDLGDHANNNMNNMNIYEENCANIANNSSTLRNKGVYRSVVVELEVSGLMVASLCATAGGTNNHTNSNSNASDEAASTDDPTHMAVQVLRQMIQQWIKDKNGVVVTSKNEASASASAYGPTQMLEYIHRLTSTPTSLHYDPTLHHALTNCMQQTFLHLLHTLQTLGCTVIYGSHTRIIVCTHKYTLRAAKEYIDFVINTFEKSFQFASKKVLDVRPNKIYSNYIFWDEYNFGGVEFQPREKVVAIDDFGEQYTCQLPDYDDKGQYCGELDYFPKIVGHWNMAKYLSSELQNTYFQSVIGRFSREPFKRQMSLLADMNKDVPKETDSGMHKNGSNSRPSIVDDDLMQMEVAKYLKRQVSTLFHNDLTRILTEIIQDRDNVFPHLPGSHEDIMTNSKGKGNTRIPALEFAKTIVEILSLDKEVENEVHVLRKSLLTQLGAREYSSTTVFVNPCAEFVLQDVFCSKCVVTRDLNLCVGAFEDDTLGNGTTKTKAEWVCEECHSPYDTNEIEWRLIDIIQQQSVSYQLQDLRCGKTNAVQRRCMARQSDCSAEWGLDVVSSSAFIKRLKIIKNLAEFHDLDWLLEVCNGLLLGYSDIHVKC